MCLEQLSSELASASVGAGWEMGRGHESEMGVGIKSRAGKGKEERRWRSGKGIEQNCESRQAGNASAITNTNLC